MADIKNEHKVKNWIRNVSKSGCTVDSVNPITEIRKNNGELLFTLLDTVVTSPEGHRLPHIVFIRGHACVIITLLRNRQTGEEKFLMVRQRRIGNGQASLEFPAGMLDELTEDPLGVAVRELTEETGLKVHPDELVLLTEDILYSSAGASDEGIYYFGCIKELDDTVFSSFQNRICGNVEENEHITVELLSRNDAEPRATSAQVRLGFYLFECYQKKSNPT